MLIVTAIARKLPRPGVGKDKEEGHPGRLSAPEAEELSQAHVGFQTVCETRSLFLARAPGAHEPQERGAQRLARLLRRVARAVPVDDLPASALRLGAATYPRNP